MSTSEDALQCSLICFWVVISPPPLPLQDLLVSAAPAQAAARRREWTSPSLCSSRSRQLGQSCWVKASIQLWLLGTHLPQTPWTCCSSASPPSPTPPPLHLSGAAPSSQPSLHDPTDLLYFSSPSPCHTQPEDTSCSPSSVAISLPGRITWSPSGIAGMYLSEGLGQLFPSWKSLWLPQKLFGRDPHLLTSF